MFLCNRRTILPHWNRSVALELSFSLSRTRVVPLLEPLSNPNLKSPLSNAVKASSIERTGGLRSVFPKCGCASLPEQSRSANTVVRPPWFAENFIWLEILICETLGWFVLIGRDKLELQLPSAPGSCDVWFDLSYWWWKIQVACDGGRFRLHVMVEDEGVANFDDVIRVQW
ncbi:hypothetical protein VIGAN_08293600 [Vigna angularis var. angularis]|uniref:Uncharacterized protein n=1 Tax=Vigna angularis var. angularis TaxID=157739 RepID=A0A0S3ST98_PHAAN|nr:hypothetical protein VIGAN_08293600 [Vigna angularis var. angularis]